MLAQKSKRKQTSLGGTKKRKKTSTPSELDKTLVGVPEEATTQSAPYEDKKDEVSEDASTGPEKASGSEAGSSDLKFKIWQKGNAKNVYITSRDVLLDGVAPFGLTKHPKSDEKAKPNFNISPDNDKQLEQFRGYDTLIQTKAKTKEWFAGKIPPYNPMVLSAKEGYRPLLRVKVDDHVKVFNSAKELVSLEALRVTNLRISAKLAISHVYLNHHYGVVLLLKEVTIQATPAKNEKELDFDWCGEPPQLVEVPQP
jgi:hypothetical protein